MARLATSWAIMSANAIDWSDPASIRAEAERRALLRRERKPFHGPVAVPCPPEDSARREKETQSAVVKLFRSLGAKVYSTSQSRAAKVTPGMPDLWCVHEGHTLAFWWETKRPRGGIHSDAQLEFAAGCASTGTLYGTGSLRDAEEWCIAHGLATRHEGGAGYDGYLMPCPAPAGDRPGSP